MAKRRTKVGKKEVLKKTVLMYDCSKKYLIKSWNKIEIATLKTDCCFNALYMLEMDG